MPEIINVPKPVMTDYQKSNFAIEVAFNNLIDEAMKLGLPISKPMGLMYLPEQELTRNFQVACREILESLKTPPAE